MALFNHATKEVTAKLVYYGPGLCGKTTNLQWIHDNLSFENKGKLVSLATQTDRTLFFDFLPVELGTIRGMRTRMQIYTVPGQVFYEATRRMVLNGCDAVVFVADSQAAMLDANFESLQSLRRNLLANEIDPAIPTVVQYNKRDLPTALPIGVLNERLNPRGLPHFEAIAIKGDGVEETLRGITKALFKWLSEYYAGSGKPTRPPSSAAATPAPNAPPRPKSHGGRVTVRMPEPPRRRDPPAATPAPGSTAGPATTPPSATPATPAGPAARPPQAPRQTTPPAPPPEPARTTPRPAAAQPTPGARPTPKPAPPPQAPPEPTRAPQPPTPAAAPKPAPPPQPPPTPTRAPQPPTPAAAPKSAPPPQPPPTPTRAPQPPTPAAAPKPAPPPQPPPGPTRAPEPREPAVFARSPEPEAPEGPAQDLGGEEPPEVSVDRAKAAPSPPAAKPPTSSEPPAVAPTPKAPHATAPEVPPPQGADLSEDQWLYLLDGSQRGPVDIEDLVDLVLTSIPEDTKVWHPGLKGWVMANEVSEIAQEIPPPVPVPGTARGAVVEEEMPDFDTVPPQFRTALIADEDEAFRKYLAMPLAAQGFTILEAADGSAAWQLAVQHRPWLILADVSMPELDGFEFCRRVRSHPLLSHTPLLFISGSDKYKERYHALQIGADDFLTKQTKIREILMRIQLLLTKYSDLSDQTQEKTQEKKKEGEKEGAFEGRIEVFGAPALLQMCAQGRLTGLFTALAEDDANTAATMGFRSGDIISATVGSDSGLEAAYSFLAWGKGSFRFIPGEPGEGEPLAESVEHLLLEGCRLLDESHRDGEGARPF